MILKDLRDLRDDRDGLDLMWSLFETSDLFLVNTCATTHDSTPPRLLFTDKLGKRLAAKFRGLDVAYAKAIESRVADRMLEGGWEGDLYRTKDGYRLYGDYYFIPPPSFPDGKLGLFQTRRASWLDATVNDNRKHVQKTVAYWSYRGLKDWASDKPGVRVDMLYPEDHGLTFEDCYYFMTTLPDNVFVWRI